MKTVCIGDLHGHDTWLKIVADNKDADRFIFIGDYVDSFGVDGIVQLRNLEDIIEFKKRDTYEVILLVGNHDHHYWPGIGYTGTSGYQKDMSISFEGVFNENRDLFQMCYEDEYNTIYSHAGLSKKWLKAVNITKDIVSLVNKLFIEEPLKFCYNQMDYSGYGEHPLQSCIWIRPETLYGCQISNLQVIGHTHVNQINHPPKSERRGVYMIDALPNQYLCCMNGVFEIKNV